MRRAIHTALLALIPLAGAGCASSAGGSTDAETAAATTRGSAEVALTRVGEAVQMTDNSETTHECEFIAHIELPAGTSTRDVNAMRALRNEAGRRGANLLLLVMETRTTVERAEGYLCAD